MTPSDNKKIKEVEQLVDTPSHYIITLFFYELLNPEPCYYQCCRRDISTIIPSFMKVKHTWTNVTKK